MSIRYFYLNYWVSLLIMDLNCGNFIPLKTQKKMATITLGGKEVRTSGNLPSIGTKIKDFKLVAIDLSTKTLSDFTGSRLVLNIFPSVNTGVCSASVRSFNKIASQLDNTTVLCISRDLPFAQDQFCAAEGLNNVIMLSDFKTGDFGQDYGLIMTDGGFDGLLSRVVIITDTEGVVTYAEQVPEIGQEPDYYAAMAALNHYSHECQKKNLSWLIGLKLLVMILRETMF